MFFKIQLPSTFIANFAAKMISFNYCDSIVLDCNVINFNFWPYLYCSGDIVEGVLMRWWLPIMILVLKQNGINFIYFNPVVIIYNCAVFLQKICVIVSTGQYPYELDPAQYGCIFFSSFTASLFEIAFSDQNDINQLYWAQSCCNI